MPNADPSLGQLEGVDSSHYQGTIHPIVGRDVYNIQWWAHKATEGTSYVDPTFKKAQEDLRNAGIRYRVWYHFPRGNLSIEAQVEHFLRTIGPLEVGEAAKLDDESAQSLGYSLTIDQAVRWHSLVEQATGRPTVQYTGAFVKHPSDPMTHWKSPRIRNSTIPGVGERPNILASYNSWQNVTTNGLPVHVWQWTSSATMPGLFGGAGSVGRIDRDLVRIPAPYDWACGYVGGPTPPEPEPTPPPIPVPIPPEDEDMKIIVKIAGHANAWLPNGLHLTPEIVSDLIANEGFRVVESAPHSQFERSLLHLSGLTEADLA
jgi:GH25 family lysozyme M1 (1,4-beta-N-acetylmuramidase)